MKAQSIQTAVSNPLAAILTSRLLLHVGLTAVFVAYFLVWLPGPSAGLQFIGLEMGEWTKFLGVDMSRNLFYLPPITLGLLLMLLSIAGTNRDWRTWLLRGTAVAVSLLAFPAYEDLMGGARVEYLPRVGMIGVVLFTALPAAVAARYRQRLSVRAMQHGLSAMIAIIGAVLPGWIYWQVRPIVAQQLGLPLGTGIGVWLNGAGHLLVTAVALWQLAQLPPRHASVGIVPKFE